jgi:hypothetical protein
MADSLSDALHRSLSVDSEARRVSGGASGARGGGAAQSGESVVAGVELGLGRYVEVLVSAQELSAQTSLEHVLAREVCAALHGARADGLRGATDVPRLRAVLDQAEASMRATPHAWTNPTGASRVFYIGKEHADAAAEARHHRSDGAAGRHVRARHGFLYFS